MAPRVSQTAVDGNVREETQMETAIQIAPGKTATWTGRILIGLVVLFLLFDGITKVMKVAPVLKASAELGLTVSQIVGIGILLLACTAVYVIPQTSVLGAILLTGYLGGATAIQLHAGNPAFETLFPVLFGVLTWAGPFLCDKRLRAVIPLRTRPYNRG
jgi:DoxX-like family